MPNDERNNQKKQLENQAVNKRMLLKWNLKNVMSRCGVE
jgi:hypothetical protein